MTKNLSSDGCLKANQSSSVHYWNIDGNEQGWTRENSMNNS